MKTFKIITLFLFLFHFSTFTQITLVKDINSGSLLGSSPGSFCNVNGTLFFAATTKTDGRELWKSDGTSAGTVQVADINNVSQASSEPINLIKFQNKVFFSANDGTFGVELWASDGTAAGTQMVKDIAENNFNSFPNNFKVLNNNSMYFVASDNIPNPNYMVHGFELWVTDGTTSGTVLIDDVNPGLPNSNLHNLTVANSQLYFSAYESGVAGGMNFLHDIFNTTFFGCGDGQNTRIYTPRMAASKNILFVAGPSDCDFGDELFIKAPGSSGILLKDINSGTGGSFASNFCDVNGTMFFTASTSTTGYELWKSDGTEAGTVFLKSIEAGVASSSPQHLINVNGTLFFTAQTSTQGRELWKSDGTTAGTVLVKQIRSGVDDGAIQQLTNVDGVLFFTADDGVNGRELWRSDGTGAGTYMVQDLYPGSAGSNPENLTEVNGVLYFSATESGLLGEELYKTTSCVSSSNYSRRSGSWSASSTWNCGRTPLVTDTIILEKGHIVTVATGVAATVSDIKLNEDSQLKINSGASVTVNN